MPETLPSFSDAARLLPGLAGLSARIAAQGHAFVAGATMCELLAACGSLADWPAFAASWNDLPLDTHMADQGRYRRRRHAVYALRGDAAIVRGPHQPHFQALDYNPLNGGVERWFEPIDGWLGDGPSMRTILAFCHRLFAGMAPDATGWHIEAHQFRIEAASGAAGLPTPEGMHRDGVDHVLVLLVCRSNIGSGTTLIGNDAEGFSSSFTLTEPFDAALVDDHRVHHGVTPVQALDPALPAHRDVLVVTFRRS